MDIHECCDHACRLLHSYTSGSDTITSRMCRRKIQGNILLQLNSCSQHRECLDRALSRVHVLLLAIHRPLQGSFIHFYTHKFAQSELDYNVSCQCMYSGDSLRSSVYSHCQNRNSPLAISTGTPVCSKIQLLMSTGNSHRLMKTIVFQLHRHRAFHALM